MYFKKNLLSFHSRGFASLKWLKSGNWLRVHNSLLLNRSSGEKTTLLILIEWDISRVIIYFNPRDIIISYWMSKVSMGLTFVLPFSRVAHYAYNIFFIFCDWMLPSDSYYPMISSFPSESWTPGCWQHFFLLFLIFRQQPPQSSLQMLAFFPQCISQSLSKKCILWTILRNMESIT